MNGTDVSAEYVQQAIFIVRGCKVMLSTHLAELYEVPPRTLMQSVKRNINRFPADFMFQLDVQEFTRLKSHFVISNRGGIRRAAPYAFTEQGVAMLSSVLGSERAIQVNIAIMRTFVQLRQMLTNNAELAGKIEELERQYDGQFRIVFDAIRDLLSPPCPKKRRIGFLAKDKRLSYRPSPTRKQQA